MGVLYVQYKIAKCDICGTTKQFESMYKMPDDWNNITDTYGLVRYKCVCHECSERIRDYIEEYKEYCIIKTKQRASSETNHTDNTNSLRGNF